MSIAVYITALIAANLAVWAIGPWASPGIAFALIGLDLSLRDRLHDRHGFWLKTTALADPLVRSLLETADSMAWSFHARINGRNGNDYREAQRWAENITSRPVQYQLDILPGAGHE
jgi:hypothetical protein